MLIVQKFGGSSLADAQRLRHVARLCLERRQMEQELVIVVSAMGDTTDILSSKALELSQCPPLREMDALMTTGEQQCAALLVMSLEELGLKAVSLTGWQAGILTDCAYGGSDIKFIAPGRIEEELSLGRIPVVTGFQGICPKGDITTLGRGGSDTSAVAIAHNILEKGAPAVEAYKQFLSGGCTKSPVELLKIAGVNLETPEPIQNALNVLDNILNEMEALV